MDHHQPGSAPTSAVFKPSAQHANFAVNPNAARQLQIQARLEQCRRQSPTPKNFLARLGTPSKNINRPLHLPKLNQVADPVQSASEQLNISAPVSASSFLQSDLRGDIIVSTESITPTSLNRSRPPLSAARPSSVISLESVILQRQRDRHDKVASTTVAAMVLQRSRSQNSIFSPKASSPRIDPGAHSFTRSNSVINPSVDNYSHHHPDLVGERNHNSTSFNWSNLIILNSEQKSDTADHQPIYLPSPVSTPIESTSKGDHQGLSVSITDLSRPSSQSSPILDQHSDSKFVPKTFSAPASVPSSNQALLPTDRASGSRVVQACRIRPDTESNDSLRTLMTLINPESSSTASASSSYLSRFPNSQPIHQMSDSQNLTNTADSLILSIPKSITEPTFDIVQSFPDSDGDSARLHGTVGNDLSPESLPDPGPIVQDAKSGNSNRGAAPNIIPEGPAILDNVELGEVGLSFAIRSSLHHPFFKDDVEIENAARQDVNIDPDEIVSEEKGFSKPHSVNDEKLVSSEILIDVRETGAIDISKSIPSSAFASNLNGIGTSPSKQLQGKLVSRRIITPKRSISLRKSSPLLLPHDNGQTSSDAKDSSQQEKGFESHCTPTGLGPSSSLFHVKHQSPNDSVLSLDGSSSVRSSGFLKGNEQDKVADNICLNNWYIELEGQDPFLFGIDSKTQLKVGGRILRRLNHSVILITDDKKLLLGIMDKEIMQQSFTDELVTAFANGFPKNWLDILDLGTSKLCGSTRSTPSIASRNTEQHMARSKDKSLPVSSETVMERKNKKTSRSNHGVPLEITVEDITESRKRLKTPRINGKTPRKRERHTSRAPPERTGSSRTIKASAATSISNLSNQSIAANSNNQDVKLETPNSRKRPRNPPNTVPRDRSQSLAHQDSNMMLELPLDAIEGVTFSHSGRRRVQPLKFWLTERIIAETGTICTVAAAELPQAKRNKKTTGSKTRSTSLPKMRKPSSRRKSR